MNPTDHGKDGYMAKTNRLPKEESRENRIYNRACEKPVDEKAFLLEAGQGRNVNGNVFALLDQIRHDPRFDDWSVSLVLIPEKQEEARRRLQKYGIEDVDIITFGGDEYRKALGTCKYLITDNSFPAYFNKRPEQVYLNTWHGTPLKALGRTDIANAISIANVQANMAKADWLLHPNRFTRNVMMKDYMMERVFMHKTVIMDYPRNDALYKCRYRDEITDRYGLEGKKIIAYMPTWRGTGRDADTADQLRQTQAIIEELRRGLEEDELLYVNLHFLIQDSLDLSEYDRVRPFPDEYETYDFLAVCDTLITDYSSVSIDFAGTGREIILFMYDYEQYKRDKGFYLDVKELPFKKAYSMKELLEALHSERFEYTLDEALTCGERGDSSERILDLICGGSEEGYEIEDFAGRSDDTEIAYFENINRDDSREIIANMQEELRRTGADSAPVIMFQNAMNEETVRTVRSMDSRQDFIRISGHLYCSNDELMLLRLYKKFGWFRKAADRIYSREANRQTGQFGFSTLRVMQGRKADRLQIFSRLKDAGRSIHIR